MEKSEIDPAPPPPRPPPPAGAAGAGCRRRRVGAAPAPRAAGGAGAGVAAAPRPRAAAPAAACRGPDAARHHRHAFRCGEIRTERFPGLRAVARHQQAVVADVHRFRIERGVEPFPEIPAGRVETRVSAEVRRDVPPLAGGQIDLDHSGALAQTVSHAIDGGGMQRIGHDDAELGGRQRVPVHLGDLALIAAAARHDRAGVLLRSHHPVRVPRVGGEVVDLIDGQRVDNCSSSRRHRA